MRVKYFSQKFSYLKNKIPITVILAKQLLVAYYIKGLPTQISMWVKRDLKTTLQEAFLEAVLVEKDMFSLKDNPDTQKDQPSTSRRRQDNSPKPTPQNKYPYEMDNMKKILQNILNDKVDLKRNNNDNQVNRRGMARPLFRRPY